MRRERSALLLCGLLCLPLAAACAGKKPIAPPEDEAATRPTGVTLVPEEGRFFTADEWADIQHLHSVMRPNTPYTLNLADPRQYRHVINTFRRNGITADTDPQLMRALEAASKVGTKGAPVRAVNDQIGTPQALNYINSMNLVSPSPNTYDANGLSSVNGGTEKSTIVMEMYLPSTGYVYATNQGSEYAQGTYFNLPVDGSVPAGTSDPTTRALGTFAYVPKDGGQPVVSSYYSVDTVDPTSACMTEPNYCVRNNGNCVQPVRYETGCTNTNPNNATPILVCYYRGSQENCDYYNQTPNHPTSFLFPLQGNATFANTVVSPPVGIVTITLENPNKGGGCYLVFEEIAPLDPDYWSASGQTLSWSYPAAAFPDPNNCLEYYGATTTWLNVMVDGVALQGEGGGRPPTGGFRFTSDRSQIGQDGVYLVPPIEIQQGCFAAGTEIVLADGSKKKVEDFTADQTERVKTGSGAALTVRGTSKGIEPKPMVRIQSEQGHELLVTETHAIVTKGGVKMAMDLTPGEPIRVAGGEATVRAVTREPYAGKVYHLILGERGAGVDAAGTVFANGILTGDLRMQEALEKAEREKLASDPQHVLERLAPEWHEDYRLWLERQKQKSPEARP